MITIVGNKIDLEEQRTVSTKEGEETAASFGVDFFETSAKTGDNVDAVFQKLAERVYKPKHGSRKAASSGSSSGGGGGAANGGSGNNAAPAGNVTLGNANSNSNAKKDGCC